MSGSDKATGDSADTTPRCCVCHDPADADWAEWLAGELAAYPVPVKLVGRRNQRQETIPANLRPVARLVAPAQPELPAEAEELLRRSEFLVVICSPSAAVSPGLDACIRLYKSTGRSERVVAAVVAGVPGGASAGGAEEECFAEALRFEVGDDGRVLSIPAEPLAADFRYDGRHPGWHDVRALRKGLRRMGVPAGDVARACQVQSERLRLMKLKLVAGILAINLGELTERDKVYQAEIARRRRQGRLRLAGVGVVLLAAAAYGVSRIAESRRTAGLARSMEADARALSTKAAAENERLAAERNRRAQDARVTEWRVKGLELLRGASGVPPDRARGIELLGKAAEAGDTLAQFSLAQAFTLKNQPDAETARGIALLESLGAAGVPESDQAIFVLSVLFDQGKIVPADPARAIALSEQVARRGHANGMVLLGHQLERGLGGPARIGESFGWNERAALAGHPDGMFALHQAYAQGLPAAGVAADRAKAQEWLERAAAGGSLRALYFSAASQSGPEAVRRLERVIQRGDRGMRGKALGALTRLYLDGATDLPLNITRGVQLAGEGLDQACANRDLEVADALAGLLLNRNLEAQCRPILGQLGRASALGSPRAAFVYARAAAMESGVVTEPVLFRLQMGAAARAGLAEAQFALGSAILDGALAGAELSEGVGWVAKAADQGHPFACVLAGKLLSDGSLVRRDWSKAAHYLKVAESQQMPVNWKWLPRAYRPAAPAAPAPAELPLAPARRAETPPGQLDKARGICALAGRRTREELELVLRAIPCDGVSEPADLLAAGELLVRSSLPEKGLEYLAFCAARPLDGVAPSLKAMAILAGYQDTRSPQAALQWRMLALAIRGDAEMQSVVARTRVPPLIRQQAQAGAAMVLEQHLLERAAAGAGLALAPPRGGPSGRGVEQASQLTVSADGIAAEARFDEDWVEAVANYLRALEHVPDHRPALEGLARCATELADRKLAYYCLLRAVLSRKLQEPPDIGWLAELARMCAEGDGVKVDLAEAGKWCRIARRRMEQRRAEGGRPAEAPLAKLARAEALLAAAEAAIPASSGATPRGSLVVAAEQRAALFEQVTLERGRR